MNVLENFLPQLVRPIIHTVKAIRCNISNLWKPPMCLCEFYGLSHLTTLCPAACSYQHTHVAETISWFTAEGLEKSDCVNAQRLLAQNDPGTPCYADNHGGTGCKTKAKWNSCEIKLCLDKVSGPTLSTTCVDVAAQAMTVIGGGQAEVNAPGMTVSVENRDPNDGNNNNCGSPSMPCRSDLAHL